MQAIFRLKKVQYFLLILTGLIYLKIGYYSDRSRFYELLFFIIILFGCYVAAYRSSLPLDLLIFVAICFRLLFLFSIPVLSDDFYRFIWDGILSGQGINPFAHIPEYYIEQDRPPLLLSRELYEELNSPHYFTVYPPVCQFIFRYAVLPLQETDDIILSLVLMRILFLIAEVLNFFFLHELLKKLCIHSRILLLYALNPLIVVELVGNLHFETLMISFLLASFYLLDKNRKTLSAICFAFSVATKLIPLMLLPFLLRRIGLRQALLYYAIVLITFVVLFSPFFDIATLNNMLASVHLYFDKFEFNASVYYLVRWLGYQWAGYNIIAVAGKVLPFITAAYILISASVESTATNHLKRYAAYLFSFSAYLAMSSVVHPWYVSTLVVLGILSNYRFPILWSALCFFSYATYMTEDYQENLCLVAIEYILVYGYFIIEYRRR